MNAQTRVDVPVALQLEPPLLIPVESGERDSAEKDQVSDRGLDPEPPLGEERRFGSDIDGEHGSGAALAIANRRVASDPAPAAVGHGRQVRGGARLRLLDLRPVADVVRVAETDVEPGRGYRVDRETPLPGRLSGEKGEDAPQVRIGLPRGDEQRADLQIRGALFIPTVGESLDPFARNAGGDGGRQGRHPHAGLLMQPLAEISGERPDQSPREHRGQEREPDVVCADLAEVLLVRGNTPGGGGRGFLSLCFPGCRMAFWQKIPL